MRPRLLDLFCCAGGAAVGYHRAGFDVTGVDIDPAPGAHYPFEFHHGDALEYLAEHGAGFDAIHASPPCQDHSLLTNVTGANHGMRADYRLCGCMFDLPGLRRERWFETSWNGYDLRPPCYHYGQTIDVTGHGKPGRTYRDDSPHYGIEAKQAAMGIDWMNRDELAQAIPPAFTEYIGLQLLAELRAAA